MIFFPGHNNQKNLRAAILIAIITYRKQVRSSGRSGCFAGSPEINKQR
jgi:hypothetical protein